MNNNNVSDLLNFLESSKTVFHAVNNIKEALLDNGYTELHENKPFNVKKGGKYFVTRNNSSIIAFNIGEEFDYKFKITASHSDSPCFKIKENAEVKVRNKYVQLNTEGYGGMILAPWFDIPLSVAGRVIVEMEDESGNKVIKDKLVDVDRDLLIIPNVAIHFNRDINDGYKYNKQIDMLPLFGGKDSEAGQFMDIVAEASSVNKDNIIGSDLYLYNRVKPTILGANSEFIASQSIDDLECAFTTLKGFLNAGNSGAINVYACFDNEEVGSLTYQGAQSTFLSDVLKRINISLNKSEEEYLCALADSFMLSCDNAHAVHPNHPEKTDETNAVYMNEGIVIKSNANQKYTSNGVSIAMFKKICDKVGVPYQFFANRSDVAGGSTLGNIAMSQVSIKAVDIGLPQLAMHSPYETAGVNDVEYMIRAVEAFYKD